VNGEQVPMTAHNEKALGKPHGAEAGQAINPHNRSNGLTTPSIEAGKARILSLFTRVPGALREPAKKAVFFVASASGIFAELPEIRLDRAAAPTSLWARPFKIF
jgi:hypothetical protein